MESNRKTILKFHQQAMRASSRLMNLLQKGEWPLCGEKVAELLDKGAVVEGIEIEHKTHNRQAPTRLSAVSMCVVMDDIPSLKKFMDAPFMNREAFSRDLLQACWFAVDNSKVEPLEVMLVHPRASKLIKNDPSNGLIYTALSNNFLPGVSLLLAAGLLPRLETHDVGSGTKLYTPPFSWCRSAESVQMLVQAGIEPRPPQGHEHSLSDLAKMLDLAGHKPQQTQEGAIEAIIELIKLGYPLENVADGHGSLSREIPRASQRMTAKTLAPLMPWVEKLRLAVSSCLFSSPRGAAVLMDAGMDLDMYKIGRNWSAWISNCSPSDKESLSKLLDAGLRVPSGEWLASSLEEVDFQGETTGEPDEEKCLFLLDIGVPLPASLQALLIDNDPSHAKRIESAFAKASARAMQRQTPVASSAPAVRRM